MHDDQQMAVDSELGEKREALDSFDDEEEDDDDDEIVADNKKKQFLSHFKSFDVFDNEDIAKSEDQVLETLGLAFLSLEPSSLYASSREDCNDISIVISDDNNCLHTLTFPDSMFFKSENGSIHQSSLLQSILQVTAAYTSSSAKQNNPPISEIPASHIVDVCGIGLPNIVSDIKRALFPLETGLKVKFAKLIILQPMVPYSPHSVISLAPEDIGIIEIVLPCMFFGFWRDISHAARFRYEHSSKAFMNPDVYEKIRRKEIGFAPEDVVKFSVPYRAVSVYAWNRNSVGCESYQSILGMRVSLLFTVSSIAPLHGPGASRTIDPSILFDSTSFPSRSSLDTHQTHSSPQQQQSMVQDAPFISENATMEEREIEEEMTPAVISSMIRFYNYTLGELRLMCRDSHLTCSGTKDEVIRRLAKFENSRSIKSVPRISPQWATRLAQYFGHVLLQSLRNNNFVAEQNARVQLGFPCRHLYDGEHELPAIRAMTESPGRIRSSQLMLRGADSVFAVIAANAGLLTRMYRVGCIKLRSSSKDMDEQAKTMHVDALYFGIPLLPTISSLPAVLDIQPLVLQDRLVPVLTLEAVVNNMRKWLEYVNLKGEKHIPLEQILWAVKLPNVHRQNAVCLPSFLPMHAMVSPNLAMLHQDMIPQAIMSECYVRHSSQETSRLQEGQIYVHSALLLEIPGAGSTERQQAIDKLSNLLSSPDLLQHAIDVVRAGRDKSWEETRAEKHYVKDVRRYSWLSNDAAQNIAKQFHADNRGTAKSILNRVKSRLASTKHYGVNDESIAPLHSSNNSLPLAEQNESMNESMNESEFLEATYENPSQMNTSDVDS